MQELFIYYYNMCISRDRSGESGVWGLWDLGNNFNIFPTHTLTHQFSIYIFYQQSYIFVLRIYN